MLVNSSILFLAMLIHAAIPLIKITLQDLIESRYFKFVTFSIDSPLTYSRGSPLSVIDYKQLCFLHIEFEQSPNASIINSVDQFISFMMAIGT